VLDWGEENLAKNGLTPDRFDFVAGDSFDWLARFAKKGEQFDLVVLDPPGFATTKTSRFTAARDYHQLVAAAEKVVAPKGLLLSMCNVEALSVGVNGLSLRTIRSAVGRQSAEPYFQFVVRLVRRGVTQEQAVRATRALIDRRVASNTLLAVADDLARDVANGVAPDAALNDRMTRLVGGTPGAAVTAGDASGPTRGLAGPQAGSRPP
jgi:hypothetical protein